VRAITMVRWHRRVPTLRAPTDAALVARCAGRVGSYRCSVTVDQVLTELRRSGEPQRVAALKRSGAASPAFRRRFAGPSLSGQTRRPRPRPRSGALADRGSRGTDPGIADRRARARYEGSDGPVGRNVRLLGDLRPVLLEPVRAHRVRARQGGRVDAAPGGVHQARRFRARRRARRP
jgi:hypothetical protein